LHFQGLFEQNLLRGLYKVKMGVHGIATKLAENLVHMCNNIKIKSKISLPTRLQPIQIANDQNLVLGDFCSQYVF
jgi:hypothetical protein